jgi:hypothetical protein
MPMSNAELVKTKIIIHSTASVMCSRRNGIGLSLFSAPAWMHTSKRRLHYLLAVYKIDWEGYNCGKEEGQAGFL